MKGSCGCGGSPGVLTAADLNRNPSRILTAEDLNRNPSKILTAKDLNGSSRVLTADDLNRNPSKILTATDLNGSSRVLTADDLNRDRYVLRAEDLRGDLDAAPGRPQFHFPTKVPHCDWIPNIWQPVHYGWQEFFAGPFEWVGGPPRMIVIYPSLTPFDPANPSSEILQGTYPLIAFAHGNCGTVETGFNTDIYKSWIDTLATLARAGYVVVIPKLPAVEIHPSEPDVEKREAPIRLLANKLRAAIDWLVDNEQSPFANYVDVKAFGAGLAGHREGAYAAAVLAAGTDPYVPQYPNVRAYASLSGYFLYLGEFEHPGGDQNNPNWYLDALRALTVPHLFMIGAQGSSGEAGAPDDTQDHVNDIGIFDWDGIKDATTSGGHGVVFNGGHVYDYLNVDAKTVIPATPVEGGLFNEFWKNGAPKICDVGENTQAAGACPVQQWLLARDILTTFFSLYMPPTPLPWPLAHTLVPPGIEDLNWFNGQLVNHGLSKECAAAQAAVWKPQGWVDIHDGLSCGDWQGVAGLQLGRERREATRQKRSS